MNEKLFSVLPMTQRFTMQGGETYTGSITVVNPMTATEDFAYLVTVTPYNVIGTNYAADLTTRNLFTEIADWITIENPTGIIHPNENVQVNYTITVPENVHGGGQYATLLVSSDPSVVTTKADAATVNNVYQLASVIYADIGGEITREGSVITNEIPGFSANPSITLAATIENKGNVHQDAITRVNITNAFTGELIFPEDESESSEFSDLIMPESTRYVTHEISDLPMVGLFNVQQTIYFNDIPYTAESQLFICPFWLLFVIFFVFSFTIIGTITGILHHRRKRKSLPPKSPQ
ncbi:hypothetical protein IKG05_01850 [Candidatus Saccharibacteria bacterium]|nr:hypothetical protein [Candidatus Saccharibacteria bacterium]